MLRFRHRTAEGIVEATAESPAELETYDLAIPVEPPEVWGAGVTYQRSLDARVEESTAKEPNNASYQFHLGLAYAKAGVKDKARTALERALRISSQFEGAEVARKTLADLQS